jgi:ubiquinone/menaquinone biosynthesis C-methylase UbiE
LVPGCGNSLLSEKLCTIMNQTNITSCDFVTEVVAKMNARGVAGITYTEMDFLNMTYADNSFDVSLDKGCFDGICLDNDTEAEKTYSKYLNEEVRVLDGATNGKFMCISLLQSHVLEALLDFFIRGKSNLYFETHTFDLQLIKLEKICNKQESA